MSEFIQKFIVEHRVECPYCDGTAINLQITSVEEPGERCGFCLGSGWVDDRDLQDEEEN